MGEEMTDDYLSQGIAAINAGNKQDARRLLSAAIQAAPNDERTWGWFYNVAANNDERLKCLKEVLRINPSNEKAKLLLQKLVAQQNPTPNPRTPSGTTSTIPPQLIKKKSNLWIFVVGGFVFIFFLLVTILIGNYLINNSNQHITTNLPTQNLSATSGFVIPTATQPITYTGNWQTSLGKSAFDDSPTVDLSVNADSSI